MLKIQRFGPASFNGIGNFGKFCAKEKSKRRGRNPATGKSMILKPRRIVTFKCSGKMREKINGKKRKRK